MQYLLNHTLRTILSHFPHRIIIEKEGPYALWKGLGPNLVGVAPSRAIYFCSYSNAKKFFNGRLKPESPVVHMASAVCAGERDLGVGLGWGGAPMALRRVRYWGGDGEVAGKDQVYFVICICCQGEGSRASGSSMTARSLAVNLENPAGFAVFVACGLSVHADREKS